jgi:DNA-binding PadR family transcriptional regulator
VAAAEGTKPTRNIITLTHAGQQHFEALQQHADATNMHAKDL